MTQYPSINAECLVIPFDPKNYPRIYKISKEVRMATLPAGIVLTFFSTLFFFGYAIKFKGFSFVLEMEGISLVTLIIGLWCLFPGFGIFLTLHPDAVEYRRFFYRRIMRRDDIAGTRWLTTVHGSRSVVFVPKNPHMKSLSIVTGFDADEFYDSWMSTLPYCSFYEQDPLDVPPDKVIWDKKLHSWRLRRSDEE